MLKRLIVGLAASISLFLGAAAPALAQEVSNINVASCNNVGNVAVLSPANQTASC